MVGGASAGRRWVELDVRGEILKASPETIGALGRSFLTETCEFNTDSIPLDFSIEAVKILLEALTLAKHQMIEESLQVLHKALRSHSQTPGSQFYHGSDLKALLEFLNLGWVVGVTSPFGDYDDLPKPSEVDTACGDWGTDHSFALRGLLSLRYRREPFLKYLPSDLGYSQNWGDEEVMEEPISQAVLDSGHDMSSSMEALLVWSPSLPNQATKYCFEESFQHVSVGTWTCEELTLHPRRVSSWKDSGIAFDDELEPSIWHESMNRDCVEGLFVVDLGPRRVADIFSFMIGIRVYSSPESCKRRLETKQPMIISVRGISDVRQSRLGDEPAQLTQLIQPIRECRKNSESEDWNGVWAYPQMVRLDVSPSARSWNRMFAFQVMWSDADEELGELDLCVSWLEMFGTVVELPKEVCPDVRKNFDFGDSIWREEWRKAK